MKTYDQTAHATVFNQSPCVAKMVLASSDQKSITTTPAWMAVIMTTCCRKELVIFFWGVIVEIRPQASGP